YQRYYWYTSVCCKDDCFKIIDSIKSDLTSYKLNQYEKFSKSWSTSSGAMNFGAPTSILLGELNRRSEVTNRSWRELGFDYGGSVLKTKLLNKKNINKYLNTELLNDLADGDLVWEPVKSIEFIGEIECYDFSMKNEMRPYAVV